MELSFLIPAVTFFLVSTAVMIIGIQTSGTIDKQTRWTIKRLLVMMVPGAIAALIAWTVYAFVIPYFWAQEFPRSENEPAAPAWAGISYFAAMVIGMAAHTAFEAVKKGRQGAPPIFNPWSFLQPALVAPIIFLGVRGMLVERDFTLEAILLAFQNGFFWQTVFEGIKETRHR